MTWCHCSGTVLSGAGEVNGANWHLRCYWKTLEQTVSHTSSSKRKGSVGTV